MGSEHRRVNGLREMVARSFKSGNSVALRLPKGLGFRAGDDIVITDHQNGTFSIRKADDNMAALDTLYGAFSETFMADGRGDTEQLERDWTRAGQVGSD